MPNGVGEFKLALDMFKLAKKEGWIDKLRNLLKKRHHVLVLGSTGVGKTNLLQSLYQDIPKAIYRMNRTEAIKTEKIQIHDNPFVFLDTPGQSGHRSIRSDAIFQALSKRRLGVLNVVAYGFHEYRTGTTDALTRQGEAKKNWLAAHRKIECDALHEWTDRLGSNPHTKWILTVATKADLWWSDEDDVRKYYESGPYHRALGPAFKVSHTVREHCTTIKRFYDQGFVCPTFDEPTRTRLRNILLQTMLNLVGKEAKT